MNKNDTDINSVNAKYPPVNDLDDKWGLVVTTVGYQQVMPKEPYPVAGHPQSYNFNPKTGRTLNEYQMLYFTKGGGTFTSVESSEITIEPGMILMLFPYAWHTYTPDPKTGWDQYWIGFKGNFADELVKNKFITPGNPVFKMGFSEQLVKLYQQATEAAGQERIAFQQYISGIAVHMLGLVYYTLQNNQFIDEEIVSKINHAKLIMREYPTRQANPEEIAADLNMSYSWFRKMFKKYTGLSPTQYQLQIKVQKAKEFLTGSSMAVKEISEQLQFESINYFISFFKEKTSESPAEFRNRIHNIQK